MVDFPELSEQLPSDSSVLIFASTHLLARLVGRRSFNMTIIGEVQEGNYVPVEEDKLKEDQHKEYLEAIERYKRECLKSYNITRSGDY